VHEITCRSYRRISITAATLLTTAVSPTLDCEVYGTVSVTSSGGQGRVSLRCRGVGEMNSVNGGYRARGERTHPHRHAVKPEVIKPTRANQALFSKNIVSRHVRQIRYDTRCYFNVRSKADISQLNLPHGTDN